MKRLICMMMVIAAMAGFVSAKAFAGGNSTRLMVSARVLPYMEKNVVNRISSVNITDKDIARGYVDVNAATVVEVRTNTRGYMLWFGDVRGPFTAVDVVDGKRTTTLSVSGGFIYQGGGQGDKGGFVAETKILSYRFYLAGNTSHGAYSWPVAMDVVAN